jgi:hypothetical protein
LASSRTQAEADSTSEKELQIVSQKLLKTVPVSIMICGRLYIEFQCTLILGSSDFYTRESLPTSTSIHERLSNAAGLAVLASDALSSVA